MGATLHYLFQFAKSAMREFLFNIFSEFLNIFPSHSDVLKVALLHLLQLMNCLNLQHRDNDCADTWGENSSWRTLNPCSDAQKQCPNGTHVRRICVRAATESLPQKLKHISFHRGVELSPLPSYPRWGGGSYRNLWTTRVRCLPILKTPYCTAPG